jgi:hypothetical protein
MTRDESALRTFGVPHSQVCKAAINILELCGNCCLRRPASYRNRRYVGCDVNRFVTVVNQLVGDNPPVY